MYPRPCRRFFTTSFEGVSSSGGSTFFISFSNTCNTNSSTDSYPQASAHFCAFSSNSPSIFTLCVPNNVASSSRSVLTTYVRICTVPPGLSRIFAATQDLRPGLTFFAPPRACALQILFRRFSPNEWFSPQGRADSNIALPIIAGDFGIPNSDRTVGAMSVRAGDAAEILRLLNRTPGTSV